MDEKKSYFLSGGVLFFLLTQATLPNSTPREHRNGAKDDHSDPLLMTDFIHTFTGSRSYGAQKDTSQYKDCQSEGSCNIPFNDAAAIAAYDDVVRNRFSEALSRMDEFVARHLNPEKRFWLVKALLDILSNDNSIQQSDCFYIDVTGANRLKNEIEQETDFCLPSFLTGVLHYILTKRRGRNCEGVLTLDAISSKRSRKPRVYTGHLGEGIVRRIDVAFNAPQCSEGSQPTENNDGEAIEEDVVIQDESAGHGEGDGTTSESTDPHMAIIHQQINVIQNGEKNINMTNNGTMTINL